MTEWWKSGIVYQIYPRSFQDTNGDGIGDLPGITQRLDYLADLGVTALWISPMYPSPMADFGYDVSNYIDVHPMFGTLADMDKLIEEAHQRDLRIILDYVPNHSSHQHPWFLESRSSRDNPKRDWYIWHDPAPGGGPPNNWISRFDGDSAWEWDETTEQYYLHSFLKEQPDLNWRNPEVRETMLDVVRFWYDRGVDGLRVDVSYRVMKDPAFRDNPINPDWREGMEPYQRLGETMTKNTPDIHMFNRWLRAVNDEYDDRVLIGEMNLPYEKLVAHYGSVREPEFHLPFNFHLVFSPWEVNNVRQLVESYEAALPDYAWPNWVLSNHDQPRFATRAGIDNARLGMLFLLTVRGTPTIYYGDELGMENVDIPPELVQDPWELLTPGLGLGRDPVRTPMQWDGSTHAGFSEVSPWLPVANNAQSVNVAVEQADPNSMLAFTQRLIALRKTLPALQLGDYRTLETSDVLYAFERFTKSERVQVVLNFGADSTTWKPDGAVKILLASHDPDPPATIQDGVELLGHAGAIVQPLE
ncbi:MAG: DUF3459 domain-containing protein [Chloroflexi bacterium]|nr:DUF3459 domain-containing protein [Chloroflexota bacterium]